MTRYTFEFISVYQGRADYRIWRDGKSDTRITAHRSRKVTYSDGSPLLRAELDAFNAYKREEHAQALVKHGSEFIDPWQDYT